MAAWSRTALNWADSCIMVLRHKTSIHAQCIWWYIEWSLSQKAFLSALLCSLHVDVACLSLSSQMPFSICFGICIQRMSLWNLLYFPVRWPMRVDYWKEFGVQNNCFCVWQAVPCRKRRAVYCMVWRTKTLLEVNWLLLGYNWGLWATNELLHGQRG